MESRIVLAGTPAKEAVEDNGELNIVHNRIPITIATEQRNKGSQIRRDYGKTLTKNNMQIVFPDSRTENKIENTNNIGVNRYCLWPWENKIIFPQVQINRQSYVPLP